MRPANLSYICDMPNATPNTIPPTTVNAVLAIRSFRSHSGAAYYAWKTTDPDTGYTTNSGHGKSMSGRGWYREAMLRCLEGILSVTPREATKVVTTGKIHDKLAQQASGELASMFGGRGELVPSVKPPLDLMEVMCTDAFPDGQKCKDCGGLLPLESFVLSTQGYSTRCRPCWNKYTASNWYASPESMLSCITVPNIRVVIDTMNKANPARGLTLGFSGAEDLKEYMVSDGLWPKYVELFEGYMASNRDKFKAPSVVRKDNEKGYLPGNIDVVSYKENLSRHRRYWVHDKPLSKKSTNREGYKYLAGRDLWLVSWTYALHAGGRVPGARSSRVTWKGEFPNEEVAKEYSKKIKEEILATGTVATTEIRVGDWALMGWVPESAARHIRKKVQNSLDRSLVRKSREVGGGYEFKVFKRESDGRRTVDRFELPTEDLAKEYLLRAVTAYKSGDCIPTVTRREWVRLGLTTDVPFHRKPSSRGGTRLTYMYRYTKVTAVLYTPEQERAFSELVSRDLSTHGKITLAEVVDQVDLVAAGLTQELHWVPLNFSLRRPKMGVHHKTGLFSAQVSLPEDMDTVRSLVLEDIRKHGRITLQNMKLREVESRTTSRLAAK